MKPLSRATRDEGAVIAVIAGVAAAVADAFGASPRLVRILFVLLGLVGAGELLYVALWIILPQRQRP